ncbi:MAG: V4R domain-containing protein [Candidatus Nanoarchaeia archaeon]
MNAKRFLRLKTPMRVSNLAYTDSELTLKGVPGGTMPMDTFILLSKVLKKKDHMYVCGQGQSREMLEKLVGDELFPFSMTNLRLMLTPIELSGMGEIEIVRYDHAKHSGMFRVRSVYAKQYEKLFSIQKDGVDLFLAGMISGCIEYFIKKKIKVKETACVAQGKTSCVFESRLLK